MSKNILAKGERYIELGFDYQDQVLAGEIPTSELTFMAVKRQRNDLVKSSENAPDFPYYFSAEQAARVLTFFSYLKHSKGQWAGQEFVLEPWQAWVLMVLFGWQKREAHTRRFNTGYIEIPRKNGKTTLMAGVAVYGLTKDKEQGAEIYAAATKKEQARILFDEAARMIAQSPAIYNLVTIFQQSIVYPDTFSKFVPLANERDSLDGLNPHFALVDELHAHRTPEVWDDLESGQGARSQSLQLAITTAGRNPHGICYEIRSYLVGLLKELLTDDNFFGIIYTIDKDDDWLEPQNWRKANPNYRGPGRNDGSVKDDYLQGKATKAIQVVSARTNFLTKNLNVWTQGAELWVNQDQWDACAQPGLKLNDILKLEPGKAFGGLDLAKVNDLCAFYVCFPIGEKRYLWGKHYLPELRFDQVVKDGKLPYEQWREEGHLVVTPGKVADYSFIQKDIEDFLDAFYGRAEVAYDRWNASMLVKNLENEGADMVQFGQGFVSMNPALNELERLYLSGLLVHDGNPVLKLAASALTVDTDAAGNIKPNREKATQKIDPMIAVTMAIGRALVDDARQQTGEAFYLL